MCFISVSRFKMRQMVDVGVVHKQTTTMGPALTVADESACTDTFAFIALDTYCLPCPYPYPQNTAFTFLPPWQWSDNLQPCLPAKFNPRQFLHSFFYNFFRSLLRCFFFLFGCTFSCRTQFSFLTFFSRFCCSIFHNSWGIFVAVKIKRSEGRGRDREREWDVAKVFTVWKLYLGIA